MLVPVSERVFQAHLEHYCPGGAGVPVTGSGPIGLSLPAGSDARAGWADNAACAAGHRCERCGQPIAARQDARKRADGAWVHESCPDGAGRAPARA